MYGTALSMKDDKKHVLFAFFSNETCNMAGRNQVHKKNTILQTIFNYIEKIIQYDQNGVIPGMFKTE